MAARKLATFALGNVGRVLPKPVAQRAGRYSSWLGYLTIHQEEFVIDHYHEDIKLKIDPRSNIERTCLRGNYDPELTKLIRENLHPGGRCLDIGANVGAISLLMAKLVGSEGRVMAFEPGPKFVERLRSNLALNPRLEKRVSVHQMGLSDKAGSLKWSEDSEFPGNAWCLGEMGESVPVTTLDQFLITHSLDRLDLMKIDVEGMELEVLRGATESLRRYRPVILLETSLEFEEIRGRKIREELEGFLDEMNYSLFGIFPGGRLAPMRYPHFTQNALARPR